MSTRNDYNAFMNKVCEKTGLDAFTPDEGGLARVLVEEKYALNIQYVEVSSKIYIFSEVTTLPENTPAAIYRELLTAGLFGQETGGGSFAIESSANTVVYQYSFDFDPETIDVEDFTETLEKIVSLVDLWARHISDLLAGDNSSAAGAATESSGLSSPFSGAFRV